jgi:hypothetical protein
MSDPVEQILSRIQRLPTPPEWSDIVLTLPASLWSRVRETLRVLASRIPVGRLDPKIDRSDVRALCVLEYVYRTTSPGQLHGSTSASARGSNKQRLDIASLSVVASVRPKQLEEFHSKLLHYVLSSRPAVATNPPVRRTNRQTTIVPSAAPVSIEPSSRQGPSRQQRWKEYTIRFAPFIGNDSVGFLRQVETWWDRFYHRAVCEGVTCEHNRRGKIYDWQRYGAAYEAACFYYVAVVLPQHQAQAVRGTKNRKRARGLINTSSHGMQRIKKQTKSSSGSTGGCIGKKSTETPHLNGDDVPTDDDENDNNCLTMDDLLDSSSDLVFSELKYAIKNMTEWGSMFFQGESQARPNPQTLTKSVGTLPASQGKPLSLAPMGTKGKRASKAQPSGESSDVVQSPTLELNNETDAKPEQITIVSPSDSPTNQSWSTWQETMIRTVVQQTRRALDGAREADADLSQSSWDEALLAAADDVLRRFGLLDK